jgi:uncharacterized Zn-binding protein involved in type VI secretion
MGKPAARVGDMHVCPMVTGTTPHVGGPIAGPGVPTVLIGGMPAAVLGDMATCVGPPDSIAMGSAGVMIGGKPAARMGDMCSHGGSIVAGLPTVLIGESASVSTGIFAALAKGILTVWNVGLNVLLGGVAGSIATVRLTDVAKPLIGLLPLSDKQKELKKIDGQFVDANCQTSKDEPVRGKYPKKCPNGPKSGKKIYYTNGVFTAVGDGKNPGLCKTLQSIADATCAEVVGIYNATEGIRDLKECIENIDRTAESPAKKTQVGLILKALSKDPPQELNLFAHSQGGLISQQALSDAKQVLKGPPNNMTSKEVELAMKKINVTSFGTATRGWPKGPNYEHYTNISDPIPGLITGVQAGLFRTEFVRSDNTHPHEFNQPNWNPVKSHDMEEVYLREFQTTAKNPCECK